MNDIYSSNIQKLKDRNKVRISTIYQKNDIAYVDEYPAGESEEDRVKRDIYKYYCPICLRYFNHILMSNCC
jgi:hypothetical protein